MSNNGVVKYNAEAKVQSMGNLSGLLKARQDYISRIAPRYLNAEKLLKLVLVAANKNPKILECTQESVVSAVITAAELGLDVSGNTGEGYLVPYFNKRAKRYECQFIPGYKGLSKLAYQTGEVRRIEAEVVYENDQFDFEKGLNQKLRHVPNVHGDRGEPIGAWALVERINGGINFDFMPTKQIRQVQSMSQMGDSGPWKAWPDEMWKKTVWRRLSKWTQLSSEKYQKALELSDQEYDLSKATPDTETDDLNARLELTEPDEIPETLFEDGDE